MWGSLYYSLRYNTRILVGKNTKIDIDWHGRLEVKDNGYILIGVRGFDNRKPTLLRIQKGGILLAENKFSINCGSIVFVYKNANLKVGENTYINSDSYIFCNHEMEIGNNCAIGFCVMITDGDGHQLFIDSKQKASIGPVKIGDHVWIGARATILKNVNIGNNSVVAASSLLKSSVPANCLSAGLKNKDLIENVKWTL